MSTCVVVGHGRSLEGRGWGHRIDMADVVVRMWNHHWQTVEDWGAAYTYGVIELHPTFLGQFWRENQRDPKRGYVASDLWRRADPRLQLPPNALVVDQRRWTHSDLGRSIGGRGATGKWELTRGGIAACWALENALDAGGQLVLAGLDDVRAGMTSSVVMAFPQAYRAMSTVRFDDYPALPSSALGNHDYPAERRLIEELAWEGGCSVAFAQDLWD